MENNLITIYDALLNEEEVIVYDNYVPIDEKLEQIRKMIPMFIELKNGVYEYEPTLRRIVETILIYKLYTNIEITEFSKGVYDSLNTINADFKDVKDVNLLHLTIDDVVEGFLQKNTINNMIANATVKITDYLGDFMEHVNLMLDKGDPNKIAKYLSKGIEVIANKMPDLSDMDQEKLLEKLKNSKMN